MEVSVKDWRELQAFRAAGEETEDSKQEGKAPASPFAEIRHPKKRAWLRAFVETASVGFAARVAGVHRSTHRAPGWGDVPLFQAAYKRAKTMCIETFEDEAVRRAIEGLTRETGWYQGEAGGTLTEYSDNLLMFILKKLDPSYRERVMVEATIDLRRIDVDKLPHSVIDRIADGEDIMAVFASEAAAVMKALEKGPIENGQCEELGRDDV